MNKISQYSTFNSLYSLQNTRKHKNHRHLQILLKQPFSFIITCIQRLCKAGKTWKSASSGDFIDISRRSVATNTFKIKLKYSVILDTKSNLSVRHFLLYIFISSCCYFFCTKMMYKHRYEHLRFVYYSFSIEIFALFNHKVPVTK